jgi:Ca-activated chloride channel family protein
VRARVWLLALAPLLAGFDLLQSPNRAVETGNARMKGGKAEEALAEYDKAVKALPAEPGAHFNRGAALYGLSRFEEAAGEFLRATEAKTTALKASAFYNLGNSYFKGSKYDDAIAAYRRSLTLDPNDIRAKWNLELAQKKKKDEDEKKKKDQDKNKDDKNKDKDKDKKDDQSKNDDKKDQDKQDKQDKKDQQQKNDEQAKNDEKKDEQKKDEQKEPKEEKKEQAKNEPQKPDKAADMREIEAVLDSLERSPKDLEKERARLRAIRRAAPSKDW